tara:strand:+ start:3252 stop:4196 length:945 start_codon:yes stop_codon:yes gene_type:complete
MAQALLIGFYLNLETKIIYMKLRFIGTILSILMLVVACNDGDITGKETAHVNFKLVDHPVSYDAVLIDLVGLEYRLEMEDYEVETEVEIEVEGEEDDRVLGDGHEDDDEDEDEGEWITVDIEPQVYDILQLQNGAEALLAESEIEAGELKEIRLILGDNSKVVVDGDTIDLKVPSGSSSGLKIKVDAEIEAGEFYDVVIDFVASKSIVRTGNGKYLLKPVIRVKLVQDDDPYGSISGLISPSDLAVMVHAINAEEDTASTQPEEDGSYLINLLLPGSYTVVVEPEDDSGFSDVTIENVMVKEEEITELETVSFE